jgi:GT2 family glycosyltransferase
MDLSIIILNYNSANYLKKCLESIKKSNFDKYTHEIIVVDNKSTDDSINLAKSTNTPNTKYLLLETNKGFAHGNNQGLTVSDSKSKYVLFLNPDTQVEKDTLKKMIEFFDQNNKVDAATCRIDLVLTKKMQPECHRGFPTPWRSFCYFTNLSKLFPKSKLFSSYFLGHLDLTTIHPIEACVGAFMMVKRKVGQSVGWWNEKYFFYGEDLDFCYQLKQKGFNLYFYPHTKIYHFQGISSGIIQKSKHLSKASRGTKVMIAKASTQAMRIFYQQNLFKDYNPLTRFLVMQGINLLEIKRVFKAKYL